jgi:ATP-dependent DNA ligase
MLDKPNERISRKNTPILTMDHISVIRPAALKCPTDGELYAHGLSFQENTRLIKKYRPGETEKVIYHIYDVISELPFIDRYALAKGIVDASTNCVLVPTFKVNDEDDLNRLHKQFLSEGYEGSILRWGDEGYKVNGRSSHLLKYKDFLDETYKVVDVEPSDKNPEQGTVICQNDKGDRFGCGMKFSHAERELILLDKDLYIGQMAEVRFFEYTDGGIPRFPVCVGFRIDK